MSKVIQEYSDDDLKAELKRRKKLKKKVGNFKASELSVLAYANNFTLWHYTTTESEKVVSSAGYFNGCVDMLRVKDMLIINVDTDYTPATKFYIVTSTDGVDVGVTVYS